MFIQKLQPSRTSAFVIGLLALPVSVGSLLLYRKLKDRKTDETPTVRYIGSNESTRPPLQLPKGL